MEQHMMVPWLECMIGDWSFGVQSTCPKGRLSFGVFYSTSTTVGGTKIIFLARIVNWEYVAHTMLLNQHRKTLWN